MTETSTLPDETVSDAAHVTAAEGGAAVADALSLAELNQYLGTNYKDKSTALTALKETKAFVGKKIEAANPAPVIDPNLVAQVNSLQEQVFYANNPQYKGHEAIIKAMGSNPAEVVNTEAFKTYMEKATVADEVSRKKSVVSSNSRIGASPDTMKDAVTLANSTASSTDVAEFLASRIREANEGN